jgi:hypothetical protein
MSLLRKKPVRAEALVQDEAGKIVSRLRNAHPAKPWPITGLGRGIHQSIVFRLLVGVRRDPTFSSYRRLPAPLPGRSAPLSYACQ